MFEGITARSATAWSHVASLSSETSLGDVGIVALEGAAALTAGRCAGLGRMLGFGNAAARAAVPDVVVELSGAEGMFPAGVTSFRNTLMDFARKPFSDTYSALRTRSVQFNIKDESLTALAPATPVLQGTRMADGTYHII